MSAGPPPPQILPDGRFYWDGEKWVPRPGSPPVSGLGRRGWAILAAVIVLAVICGGGFFYSSLLFSGPEDSNCIGQAVTLQPQHMPNGSLLFQGGRGVDYFSAPMTLAGNWAVTWQSGPGQFYLALYEATGKAPWHSPWNPQPDNKTGLVASLVNSPAPHPPYAGSTVESRSGKFCLTIRSIAEDQTSADPWTVTVTPG